MSTTVKSRLVNILTVLAIVFGVFQTGITTMPLDNPQTLVTLSAITMFIVSAITTWKQFLSIEIDNSSLTPTIILAVIATLGGLNELFGFLSIPEETGKWLRWAVTIVTMMLNLLSKLIWPTEDTTSKI